MKSILERFMKYVSKPDGINELVTSDDCWLWLGYKDKEGYGKFSISRESKLAHRISWILFKEEILEDLQVRHTCDNPPCVNPNHLKLGTTQDNMDDRNKRGRSTTCGGRGDKHVSKLYPEKVARGDRNGARTHPEKVARGENSGRAKLTEIKVKEIREKYAKGNITQRELAEEYNVTHALIGYIVRNKIWRT